MNSLRKRKTWALFIIGISTVCMVGISLYLLTKYLVITDAERDIQYLMLQNKALHLYVQRDIHPALYKLQDEGEIKKDFYSPEMLSSSYMTRVMHKYLNEVREKDRLSAIYYKMAAINPRNPVNMADEFEKKVIQKFNKNKNLTHFRQIQTINGKEYLYYAVPFLVTNQACMKCHGDRKDAPRQLQEHYQGQGGFGDKIGHIRAIESIRVPLDPKLAPAHIFLLASLAGGTLILLVLLFSKRLKNIINQQTIDLKESEERFRRLTENAKDLIYRSTLPDRQFEYVSPACVSVLGYSPKQLYDTPSLLFESLHPDWKQEYEADWVKLWNGDPHKHNEFPILHTSGEIRWLNQRQVIIRNENGDPIAIEGIVTDMTKQKILEEQLLQSQKMEAIGLLAGGIAHDFNNLLTVINGYSEILYGSVENETLKEQIAEIQHAGDRASNLTRQLLAFSRKQILQPTSLNLNELIQTMDSMLGRLIGETIELTTVLSPNLSPIKADPGQIEQVLLNIVINAKDAMLQGGKIIIETKNINLDDEFVIEHIDIIPGNYVMMTISDSGTGMDKETCKRIFEPFFTTKDRSKGTGLGLSTVYGIIKQSGGNIWVYSEPGKGSTFKIILPCTKEEYISETATSGISSISLRGTETVLLVEDEEIVRKLIRKTLQSNGYKVFEASDGKRAIDVFQSIGHPIDLLLTDVIMPEMNGPELANQLKKRIPGLKVIFMSGYTDNAILLHSILENHLEYLQKPIKPKQLLELVRLVLNLNDRG